MRTFISILIAIMLIASVSSSVYADTSVDKTKNISDLDDFGKYLYRQVNTDLDLCVAHQGDTHANAADSASVLETVQSETMPRRGAAAYYRINSIDHAQRETQMQLVETYCKAELKAIADMMAIKSAARGAGAAEQYRQQAVAKLLSLAQERTNTVNRNFTMADVNVAISSQLKPFEARVDSALAEIDKRIKDLKK